ncbi:G-type lectin S-receptor-like serine/threonine-protein kinase SD2-5 [Vigna radiata var. radiata]|uniref:Receptor-like serine/threonine-protein kinase n=1 Tax=Vigna radiata var. radiata TaxID=3916 RepID=A0A1S3U5X8_VIGRR|nr:G-type lectin S-receptor-like serine/threonine-protein kinase SD2-5 [Vigna radiata var. radiata]XP_014501399.1 G-type lectin S-receptor-like serine/threonine-protein kinase SD2-5 [Vigna radiata var. radiata]XP_014501400.1 G-type lectin S-receptor-like serine/threonine-protein kinase SD2-5 [Vigna radiata var. radiata]
MMGILRRGTLFFCVFLLFSTCLAKDQHILQIYPGFSASQPDWSDHNGFFLISNNSAFGFGFFTTLDVSSFVLVVLHLSSYKVVWTANRGLLVGKSAKFELERSGNAYLKGDDGVVWATNTTGHKVRAMELLDSGNLVLVGDNGTAIWQSFSHPTDTLLPGQEFVEGMMLKSFHNSLNMIYYLSYKAGDLLLYAGFETPQVYWSLSEEVHTSSKNSTTKVHSASLMSNSWRFYDTNRALLWKVNFSEHSDQNSLWAATLDPTGAITFYDLNKGRSPTPEAFKVPQGPCSTPQPCDPYYACLNDNWCICPKLLRTRFNCKPPNISTCSSTSIELVSVGEDLDYFALKYTTPVSKSTLNSCKESCVGNCSCRVLFFENSTGRCFHFDETGSFQRSKLGTSGYVSFMKVSIGSDDGHSNKNGRNDTVLVVIIVVLTVLVIVGLVTVFLYYYKRKKNVARYPEDTFEEDDDFLDSISGMPARFTFAALCRATKDFSTKIGEGGFGSVYLGELEDGTQLAVKKLEGVGQGAKEFKAEVSIIGSIHHVHLVKLKGFCAEGPHRLLVYEYMARGSLDKWIFKNSENSFLLNWETRYNIAIGTAKGLAYLHEECEVRIIHCDIKPQNVLLDDNFTAKVSDFGLAKLMSREQSHVFTTLRGTRGYLAPEWITNYAISEKSDVFSYGMLLLEIIGGRKNYDQWEGAEKAHFPSYVFRMMDEGKLKEVLDPKIDIDKKDERVETALKVALWCIQDDVSLRPSMSKVSQMLEGLCVVPDPPSLSQAGTYSAFMKLSSGEATSSGQASFFSNVPMSCVQLSGPR